jgi:hypothetical protein
MRLRSIVRSLWQGWNERRRRESVRSGVSGLDGTGLFTTRAFAVGELIGEVPLGPPGPQTKHSLLVGLEHCDVEAPWRFLNHACRPNTILLIEPPRVRLMAAENLPASSELTMDYGKLPEKISVSFGCLCASCRGSRRIGGESPRDDAPM